MVSIVIPVYNVSAYIERCIRSVIAQSYNNIECIIVDDCTPDDSIEKCERIIANYKGPIRFIILHHGKNRGLSAARNTGIDAATSEYLFFLDSDDEIANDAIELLLKEVNFNPTVEIVVGNTYSQPHDDYYELKTNYYPYRINNNHQIRKSFFCSQSIIPVMAWNKLIRRDFILKNNLFFKEGIIHEDELWIFNVIKCINNISIINNYTYLYYKRPYSITNTSSQQNSANYMAGIILEILPKIAPPCEEMQFLFYTRFYFYYYPYIRNTEEYKKIFCLLYKSLLKHGHYKAASLFLLQRFSNKIVFNLKYKIIPKLLQEATKKDNSNHYLQTK